MNNIVINIITIIESLKGRTEKSNVPKGNVQSYWLKSRSSADCLMCSLKRNSRLASSIGAADRKSSSGIRKFFGSRSLKVLHFRQ